MQRLRCLPFISKTFWHFPRKSSSSQLCQGTFFQFYFVIKYSTTEIHGETNSRVKDGVCGGSKRLQAEAGKGITVVTGRLRKCRMSPSLASPVEVLRFGTRLEPRPGSERNQNRVVIIQAERPSHVTQERPRGEGQKDQALVASGRRAPRSPQPRGSPAGTRAQPFFPSSRCHCGIIKTGRRKGAAL